MRLKVEPSTQMNKIHMKKAMIVLPMIYPWLDEKSTLLIWIMEHVSSTRDISWKRSTYQMKIIDNKIRYQE